MAQIRFQLRELLGKAVLAYPMKQLPNMANLESASDLPTWHEKLKGLFIGHLQKGTPTTTRMWKRVQISYSNYCILFLRGWGGDQRMAFENRGVS